MKKVIIVADNTRNRQEVKIELPESPSLLDLPGNLRDICLKNNNIIFRASGWSMFPVIWEGDILEIEPIRLEDAIEGDIILYKLGALTFAHRLVKAYLEDGCLCALTSGEKGYRNGLFYEPKGIPSGSVIGKITRIKRGKSRMSPDEAELNKTGLIKGIAKLAVWMMKQHLKQGISKIITIAQKRKTYQYLLKIFVRGRVSFYVGIPLIENSGSAAYLGFYKGFNDFYGSFRGSDGFYTITAKINNLNAGRINLRFSSDISGKRCLLSDIAVKAYFSGTGIAEGLIDKALKLCAKVELQEIRSVLSREDGPASRFLEGCGFEILHSELPIECHPIK